MSDLKLDRRLTILLRDEEYEFLKKEAEFNGLTVSAYLRTMIHERKHIVENNFLDKESSSILSVAAVRKLGGE